MSVSQNYPTVAPSLSLDFANVKKLDPRISFARAGGGVYYDGKTVALAEENRLKYSEEFNQATAWTTASTATITADATTAPDSTTTADLYTVTSTTSNILFSQPPLGSIAGDFTGSIYLKASTGAQWVVVQLWKGDPGNTGSLVWFDLVNGVLGSSTAINSASAGASLLGATFQSVGDGWYRVSVSGRFSSTGTLSYLAVRLVNADGSTTSSGQDGNAIFVWGAQINSGANLIGYSKTTTATVPASYIPVLQTASANVARFDHDPVTGESLGLLVEEQRTNLVLYSEQFENAYWSKVDATITANQAVSPDGNLTAAKIVATGTNPRLFKNIALSAQSYTVSAYAKKSELSWFRITWKANTDTTAWFNLDTGVVGTVRGGTATITLVGNGLYRCTYSFNSIGETSNLFFGVSDSDDNTGYTGDGYSGIYIWGAQLEVGAFPTSYTKTEASQVTRSADSASITGANFSEWYRQDEGSFYLDTTTQQTAVVGGLLAISDGTLSNYISLVRVGGQFNLRSVIGGALEVNMNATGTVTPNEFFKTSFGYAVNDYATSTNGNLIATDTSARVPFVTRMNLFSQVNSGGAGTIKKLAYYPKRLTNEQLQALTS